MTYDPNLNQKAMLNAKYDCPITGGSTFNDYEVGNIQVLRVRGATNTTFTGFANGQAGRLLLVVNEQTSSATVTLANASTGSLAANRIAVQTGSDLVLAAGAGAFVYYSSTDQVNRVVSTSGVTSSLSVGSTVPSAAAVAGSNGSGSEVARANHVHPDVIPVTAVSAPSTGDTVTVAAGVRRSFIPPAGTLSALTVVSPASPVDGQTWSLIITQAITTLTVSGAAGATVQNAPTSWTVATSRATWVYRTADTTWYRIV